MRTAAVLYFALLFLLLCAVRLGNPIFVDDVLYLLSSSRFLLEGGKGWNTLPQCWGSVQYPVPYIWYPVRFLREVMARAILHHVSGLDMYCVLRALVIGLLTVHVAAIAFEARTRLFKPLLFGSLVFLGAAPLYLVSNRPENNLLALLLFSLVLSLHSAQMPQRARNLEPFAQAIIFLFGMALHGAMAAFFPYFLTVVWGMKHSSDRSKLLASIALVIFAASSVSTWNKLVSCNAVPHVEQFIKSFSVGPAQLLSDPFPAGKQLAENFLDLFRFSNALTFLPPTDGHAAISILTQAFARVLNAGVRLICLFMTTFCLICSLLLCFTGCRQLLRRDALLRQALGLFAGLAVWCSIRGKYPYVTPLLIGTTTVCFIVFFSRIAQFFPTMPFLRSVVERGVYCMLLFFIPLGLAASAWRHGMSEEGYGTYDEIRGETLVAKRTPEMLRPASVRPLLERCGISRLTADDRFAVDTSTFFLVPELPNMFFTNLVIGDPQWAPTTDLLKNWELSKAKGYLLPCHKFPALLSYPHVADGGLCCAVLKD